MENHLENLEEFQKILESYQISGHLKDLLQKIHLLILSSASAVGSNTVIKELIKSDKYYFLISDTTRQPRTNNGVMEANGVNYWFRSETEVLTDLKSGNYLAPAIIHNQQVSGINVSELAKAHDQAKVAIVDVEVQGMAATAALKPETKSVFLLPPSFDEWMRRLNSRGPMSQIEKNRRLESALEQISFIMNKDYIEFIINDHLPETVSKVNNLTAGNPENASDHTKAQQIAAQLVSDINDYLSEHEQ